jgi:LPXTG-motif cell wall-anchored protein
MTALGFLLPPQKSFEPEGGFLIAGAVALMVALIIWLSRRKKQKQPTYSFWLFLGAGVCLVILGFICGSHVESEAILDAAR